MSAVAYAHVQYANFNSRFAQQPTVAAGHCFKPQCGSLLIDSEVINIGCCYVEIKTTDYLGCQLYCFEPLNVVKNIQ